MSAGPGADPADLSPTLVERREAACDRFEEAWQDGRSPEIERFWSDADGPEVLREMLVVELLCRLRRGELPERGEYLARFPAHDAAIRGAFDAVLGPQRGAADRERPDADHARLFGVLAMRMEFVSHEALIAAVAAWERDGTTPLGRILVEQGALDEGERALIDRLVRKHLECRSDTEPSLDAIGPDDGPDPDLQTTLIRLSNVRSSRTPRGPSPRPPSERFRILRSVARGGLGEVFVARDEELCREVAVKAIQEPFADDPRCRRRFLLEAEFTGRLEHPGIIPVYGMGLDEKGRPFYAMRFIRGESLKDAIKRFHQDDVPGRDPGERKLSLRALLGRFVDVCNALAYAHGRGVIHRDVKPANVMLGQYGETLVVDWGLAKAAGKSGLEEISADAAPAPPEAIGGLDATQPGSWLGTPSYMSPEQADGRLDKLGPASDIYSLGATLYHLLTGVAPVDETDVLLTLHRVRRGEFPPARAINSRVPGPLEAICARAMALRMEDRYPSAKALADDIEHWLADEAVSAFREPAIMRAARWGRRHRPAVAGMAAILITAVVALSISTLLIGREAARKEEQRRLAGRNFALARDAVDRMLTEVAEVELADVPQMQAVRGRLLDRARGFYTEFLDQKGDDPAVRREAGRSHLRLGEIEDLLGDHVSSEREYRRGLALLEALDQGPAEARRDLARGRDGLGMLLKKSNRFAESEALLRSALNLRERLAAEELGADVQDLADARYHLAALLAKLPGRRHEDEAAYREAIRTQERLAADAGDRPEARRKRSRYLNNLGLLLASSGRAGEAEKAYRESIAILEAPASGRPAPGDRWQRARGHANLAMLLRSQDRPAESEAECLRARDLQRALMEDFPDVPDYRHELASILNNLGLLRQGEGRDSEAESAFREAIELQRSLLADSPRRPDYRLGLAVMRLNLASELERETPRDAVALYREALVDQERLAADFPGVADYLRARGRTLYSLARLRLDAGAADAIDLLSRAIGDHRAVLSADARNRADREFLRDDMAVYCVALLRTGRHADAASTAEELAGIMPDSAVESLRAAAFLAECATAASGDPSLPEDRRAEASEAYARRAVAVLRRAVDHGVPIDADSLEIRDLAPLRSREDFEALRRSLAPGS